MIRPARRYWAANYGEAEEALLYRFLGARDFDVGRAKVRCRSVLQTATGLSWIRMWTAWIRFGNRAH
jgi:hypothetical protein